MTMSSNDLLIVPTILPTGSLHFASIAHNGTVFDVISRLGSVDEVTHDILGELEPAGWAVQRIRPEQDGRQWEERDLEALGDGVSAVYSAILTIYTRTMSRYHQQFGSC